MARPSLVPHTLSRLLLSALTLAVTGAAVGLIYERVWLGADVAATRAEVAADVRRQFDILTARLATASDVLGGEPDALIRAASAGDAAALALFELVEQAHTSSDGLALSVYDADATPVAWSGRPTIVPVARVTGPASTFLVPSPTGLTLVRVDPVSDGAGRRVGSIVTEVAVPLVRTDVGAGGDAYELPTSVVPVRLRPRFEGASESTVEAILIAAPETGTPLAVVEVPDTALEAARDRWRRRLLRGGIGGVAVVLLLMTGPLLDWRRRTTRARTELWLTMAVAASLLFARGVAGVALQWSADAPAADVALASGSGTNVTAQALGLLLNALTLGGLVVLAASGFERWHARRSRAARRRGEPPAVASTARLVAWHLPAGLFVALVLVAYEWLLRGHVLGLDADVVRFSLHPWEVDRVLPGLGLVLLHASVLGGGAFLLRAAVMACGPPRHARAHFLVPVLWSLSAIALMSGTPAVRQALPLLPSLLAMAFVMAAAWTAGPYRLALGRASQAQRLAGFFLALLLPSVVMYPSISDAGGRARRQVIETRHAADVMQQRAELQLHLAAALDQIDRIPALNDLVGPAPLVGPLPTEAAFYVWSQTDLAVQRLTSSVELYDPAGALVSRFALNLPDMSGSIGSQDATCTWAVFEEVSPFFAEERRLLHAGRRLCGGTTPAEGDGWIEVHMVLDYGNLPFITAQSPYLALLRSGGLEVEDPAGHDDLEFTVYGWSRQPIYNSGADAWVLTEDLFARIYASRTPFWTTLPRGDATFDVYVLNDRGAIYALGYPRVSAFGHLMVLAELTVLVGVAFLLLLAGGFAYGFVARHTPTSGRALLREVRGSFYRKLYLAFVLAAVVPVLALAVVTRTYIAGLMRADVEGEATRTAAAASRVVEDVESLQARGAPDVPGIGDDLVVWLSRLVAQDVNIYEGPQLLASSSRDLFASGLLSTRIPGDVYRAIALERRPTFVGRESIGQYPYLVAAAPVRVQGREAILTVPLTSRQREIEHQIDELDRRVLLAALAFILIGAAIGYSMAERIADPVNRLMRATKRIAAGDLDARVRVTSRDELERLVEAFNGMAAELRRQRAELERTNRLEAWAEMARQVAHDIKNPLTPIQLNAEHLRRVHADRGRPLDPVLDECVTTILAQVRLLRQIASEFSSFASSPVARPVAAPLGEIVAEVVEPYRVGLADRILIEVRRHDPLPLVRIDRTLVGRALTNVIENALHAMPGTGTLSIDLGPGDAATVPLIVRDTGMGMDAQSVARIFEPYFSTKATGTGLGLTIARRNIELCGGTIHLESAPGQGATVTILLPVDAT